MGTAIVIVLLIIQFISYRFYLIWQNEEASQAKIKAAGYVALVTCGLGLLTSALSLIAARFGLFTLAYALWCGYVFYKTYKGLGVAELIGRLRK